MSVHLPSGARSATLTSVAVSGSRWSRAGFADTRPGDIPVLVVSVDGGAQWRQIGLSAPDGLGVITALTATPSGFAAAGLAGKGGSVRTVTWTSPDGLAWSSPTQATGSEITALAADRQVSIGTSELRRNPRRRNPPHPLTTPAYSVPACRSTLPTPPPPLAATPLVVRRAGRR